MLVHIDIDVFDQKKGQFLDFLELRTFVAVLLRMLDCVQVSLVGMRECTASQTNSHASPGPKILLLLIIHHIHHLRLISAAHSMTAITTIGYVLNRRCK